MKINVLIIGSGGREHAIAWKLAQSPLLEKLFIAPGNAGTRLIGENIDIQETDFEAIKRVVLEKDIKLVVVGPEEPLVKGIHDFFLADSILKQIPVIGPQKNGAQLEGSKDFSKQFMLRHGIPTAKHATFQSQNFDAAVEFLKTLKPPFVLKADGLAAGKGVVILADFDETVAELREMLVNKKFGEASTKVVIEEFLHGIEMSVFVLTDGKTYCLLPSAKDYKRIGNGDTGLNTGGMGSVSPVPFADAEFMRKIENRIIQPTIDGLQKEGISYQGFIFFGLMNVCGDPYLIEYNVRMGDPETEAVMPLIKGDLLEAFLALKNNQLKSIKLEIESQTAVCVMMVSGGYPNSYEKGFEISGVDKVENSLVFFSGSKFIAEKQSVVTSGGRVLAITSLGNDLNEAIQKSYSQIQKIVFEKKYHRTDIGQDLLS